MEAATSRRIGDLGNSWADNAVDTLARLARLALRVLMLILLLGMLRQLRQRSSVAYGFDPPWPCQLCISGIGRR